MKYQLSRILICCMSKRKKYLKLRQQMFESAQGKLYKELDIVKILRRMRKYQAMKTIVLKKYQRKLAWYFAKNVVNEKTFMKEEGEEEMDKIEKSDWRLTFGLIGAVRKTIKHIDENYSNRKLLKQLVNLEEIDPENVLLAKENKQIG